jgi:hypothetical protein
MSFESLSDSFIEMLLYCPKTLVKTHNRNKHKEGHLQVNYSLLSPDHAGFKFEVYKRQNLRPGMEDDFSCGISLLAPSGEMLTLRRYNGPSHNHLNHLELERLGYICHIHTATERYISANRKAEGFAVPTTKYKTVEGALHCLVTDCCISGIATEADDVLQTKLFDV